MDFADGTVSVMIVPLTQAFNSTRSLYVSAISAVHLYYYTNCLFSVYFSFSQKYLSPRQLSMRYMEDRSLLNDKLRKGLLPPTLPMPGARTHKLICIR